LIQAKVRFWRRFRFSLLIAAFLLAALTLYSVNAGREQDSSWGGRLVLEVVGPFQRTVSAAGEYVHDIWRGYFALVNAQKKNEIYKEELAKMEQDLVRLKELERTNRRLRGLLGLKEAADYPVVAAEVIALDPTYQFHTAVINKGTVDGIRSQMPVVHTGGVVGRIIWTSRNYSKVLLQTDPNAGLDVLVQRSRVRGVIEGAGSNSMRLKYIQHNGDVVAGDKIISSGAAGVFPPGLFVGMVKNVEKIGKGMFLNVEVEPAVNFDRLEEVLVILRKKEFEADS
jgi:rod shape-determining protein MreC